MTVRTRQPRTLQQGGVGRGCAHCRCPLSRSQHAHVPSWWEGPGRGGLLFVESVCLPLTSLLLPVKPMFPPLYCLCPWPLCWVGGPRPWSSSEGLSGFQERLRRPPSWFLYLGPPMGIPGAACSPFAPQEQSQWHQDRAPTLRAARTHVLSPSRHGFAAAPPPLLNVQTWAA